MGWGAGLVSLSIVSASCAHEWVAILRVFRQSSCCDSMVLRSWIIQYANVGNSEYATCRTKLSKIALVYRIVDPSSSPIQCFKQPNASATHLNDAIYISNWWVFQTTFTPYLLYQMTKDDNGLLHDDWQALWLLLNRHDRDSISFDIVGIVCVSRTWEVESIPGSRRLDCSDNKSSIKKTRYTNLPTFPWDVQCVDFGSRVRFASTSTRPARPTGVEEHFWLAAQTSMGSGRKVVQALRGYHLHQYPESRYDLH